jgi:hypothetical protein
VKLRSIPAALAALLLGAPAASAALQSYDLRIVEVAPVGSLFDAPPVAGPEFATDDWLFDMMSDTTFRITHNPVVETDGTGSRPFTFIQISDLRYDGFVGAVEILSLRLIDGDASDIPRLDARPITGGTPGMDFNINGFGDFSTPSPTESWTFEFRTEATPPPVPLPASALLLLGGVAGLAMAGRRRATGG